MLHKPSDFILGIGWLGYSEVLPDQEQEAPEVSGEEVGGHFEE